MTGVSTVQASSEPELRTQIRSATLDIAALVAIAMFTLITAGDRLTDGVKLRVDLAPTILIVSLCAAGCWIVRRRILVVQQALNRMTQQ